MLGLSSELGAESNVELSAEPDAATASTWWWLGGVLGQAGQPVGDLLLWFFVAE